jgi:hypothetical protein
LTYRTLRAWTRREGWDAIDLRRAWRGRWITRKLSVIRVAEVLPAAPGCG